MPLDQTHIRWIISSIGNVYIFASFIGRRAWNTLPIIGYIIAFNAGLIAISNLHPHGYVDQRIAWLFYDNSQTLVFAALSVALLFLRKSGIARALPMIYALIVVMKLSQSIYGYYPTLQGNSPPEIAFSLRVWAGAATSYLLAYCIWSRRIVAKEIHYVPFP